MLGRNGMCGGAWVEMDEWAGRDLAVPRMGEMWEPASIGSLVGVAVLIVNLEVEQTRMELRHSIDDLAERTSSSPVAPALSSRRPRMVAPADVRAVFPCALPSTSPTMLSQPADAPASCATSDSASFACLADTARPLLAPWLVVAAFLAPVALPGIAVGRIVAVAALLYSYT